MNVRSILVMSGCFVASVTYALSSTFPGLRTTSGGSHRVQEKKNTYFIRVDGPKGTVVNRQISKEELERILEGTRVEKKLTAALKLNDNQRHKFLFYLVYDPEKHELQYTLEDLKSSSTGFQKIEDAIPLPDYETIKRRAEPKLRSVF